jgi:hypothetical protein
METWEARLWSLMRRDAASSPVQTPACALVTVSLNYPNTHICI